MNVNVLVRPGIASRLNRRAGTKNEWITSRDVSVICTGSSTGRTMTAGVTSVLPLTKMPSVAYRKVHSHWNPSTWICTCGVSASGPASASTRRTGTGSATITAGIAKKTPSDATPADRLRRRGRRRRACGTGTMHQISSRLDTDEDRAGQDHDDHVELVNVLRLGGEIPCLRAARQHQQHRRGDPSRTRRRADHAHTRVDRSRLDQVTVNVDTMPFEAWGGPSVPPAAVPVCQQAKE